MRALSSRWRPGLRTRLMAVCVVIAVASITTTTWVAVTGTSTSIRDDYVQNLAKSTAAYDDLLGYAATHGSWDGVGPVAARIKATSGAGIVLVAADGRPVFDSVAGAPSGALASDPGSQHRSATPAAAIDPLQPDLALTRSATIIGIDARAVGRLFPLSTSEQARIRASAQERRSCLAEQAPVTARIATYPNGRAYISTPYPSTSYLAPVDTTCPAPALVSVTDGEEAGAIALNRLMLPCLRNALVGRPRVDMMVVMAGSGTDPVALNAKSPEYQQGLRSLAEGDAATRICVGNALRTRLAGLVAPRVQLYLTGPGVASPPRLSSDGVRRIAAASGGILLATVALCLLAATSLRRPLAALTTAVQDVAAGERGTMLTPRGTRESVELAVAVNTLSARLEQAERRRQEMVGDVAHELRGPLGTIRGWLEAVHDGLTDPSPELVSSLLEECRLLQAIIDDLQDLALADAGELRIHPEPVDLGELIRQVAGAHAVAASAKGLRLRTELHGSRLDLMADPQRLRQLVGNLTANAVRYTEAGEVVLLARGSADAVEITVTDTGIGIAEEDLPYLFERFWRAEKSRSRRSGGSGLGLAITRHLVQEHGGQIEVHSSLGAGTTVTVSLPRR